MHENCLFFRLLQLNSRLVLVLSNVLVYGVDSALDMHFYNELSWTAKETEKEKKINEFDQTLSFSENQLIYFFLLACCWQYFYFAVSNIFKMELITQIGHLQHWGLTPAVNILKHYPFTNHPNRPLRMLVSGCADIRHILKTLCDLN